LYADRAASTHNFFGAGCLGLPWLYLWRADSDEITRRIATIQFEAGRLGNGSTGNSS
jgi:hypothetical protein